MVGRRVLAALVGRRRALARVQLGGGDGGGSGGGGSVGRGSGGRGADGDNGDNSNGGDGGGEARACGAVAGSGACASASSTVAR